MSVDGQSVVGAVLGFASAAVLQVGLAYRERLSARRAERGHDDIAHDRLYEQMRQQIEYLEDRVTQGETAIRFLRAENLTLRGVIAASGKQIPPPPTEYADD